MLALVLNPPACPGGWYDAGAPLELALAAGALRGAGCTVEVLDLEACQLSFADVEGWVGARGYDLIYTAGVNEQADYLRWFSRVAAETRPWAPLLIGGFAAVSLGGNLLRHSLAHAVVIAEPEPVLAAAAAALRTGRPLAEVPGLIVRDRSRRPQSRDAVMRTPEQPRPPDLGGLAWAAWGLFPTDVYLDRRYRRGAREVTRALPLLLSRGCPHECAYCLGEEGREVRFRDLEDAIAEADELHRRLGVRHLMFRGVAVPTNDAVSMRLAELMAERGHLTWEIRTRLDMMTPERLRQFKQAGCIFIGYEPEVLDEGAATGIRRCLNVERMRAVLQAHRAQRVPFALRRLLCAYGGRIVELGFTRLKRASLETLLPRDPANAPLVVRFYPGTALYRDLAMDARSLRQAQGKLYGPREIPATSIESRAQRDAAAEGELELYLPSQLDAATGLPGAPLDVIQTAELRYRVNEFPRRAVRLPRLGAQPQPAHQPRIAVIGAAKPEGVAAALRAAHAEYPEGRFLLAVSAAAAARLESLRDDEFRVVSLGEVGARGLLRELRAMRPHLVVIATDETSGRYSRAKLLSLLAGGRRAVYDAVTDGFVGFRGELWREIKARLGRVHMPGQVEPDQLAGARQSPLDVATGRTFLELVREEERLLHIVRYEFARRFVDPGDRVLDCSCEVGYGAAILAQTGARVTGVDPAPGAVRYAQWRYGNGLDFVCADATRLPYPDDTFDVVISFETVERIPDDHAYLAEMSRVLKPHGLFVASTPWQPWAGSVWPSRVREYTRPEFERLLGERFFVRDVIPQMDDTVTWRLPLGRHMLALCENAKGGAPSVRPERWSRYRPQVSVIMCTWNAGRYLEEALESIFAQTFQDFEFLVVDNNSTDGTRERLRELHDQGKLRLIALDENLGVSRGLLVALAHSRGRFIARMDADDRSRPRRLERQVEYLTAHPDVYVLGTRVAGITTEGQEMGDFLGTIYTHDEIAKALEVNSPIPHGSVMFRRELLREVGTYDLDYDEAEDYDLWLRVYRQRTIEILPDLLYDYRVHERQATRERRRTVKAWAKCARLANRWRREQEARRK